MENIGKSPPPSPPPGRWSTSLRDWEKVIDANHAAGKQTGICEEPYHHRRSTALVDRGKLILPILYAPPTVTAASKSVMTTVSAIARRVRWRNPLEAEAVQRAPGASAG